MSNVVINTQYYLELFITDNEGNGVTELSTTYKIIRCSDNVLMDSGSLIDAGDGVYRGSYTFTTINQFRVIYFTPTDYSNEIETVMVTDPTEQVSPKIDRILGLCQENYRLFNTVYDGNGNLLSSVIKIYPSAADVDADTNSIKSYNMSAVYNVQGQATSYKVTEV